MAKHTLKILRCEHRRIFKLCWPFYTIMHERVKGTSRDHIYREIRLGFLVELRWSRKIFFHKIINGLLPAYLQSYISHCGERVYQTRSANQNNLRQFSTRRKIFESSFFPYCTKEWDNLSEELRKIESTV